MNPRREFLLELFALLDAQNVPWCILRNYSELLSNRDTDLDLLVAPKARDRFESLLAQAAARTGYHLVHAVERACFSRIFRHPHAGLFRVDYCTELRWRVFPLMPVEAVLATRRRPEASEAPGLERAFVPTPEQESVTLWMAVLWRGYLSARYRDRLIALQRACADAAALREALRAAFGPAGDALAQLQARLPEGDFDRAFCARVRRTVIANAFRSGWRFRTLLRNIFSEARRFVRRLRRPAGAALLYFSATGRRRDFDQLSARLDFAFPAKRWSIRRVEIGSPRHGRRHWQLGWSGWRTLFQGGVYAVAAMGSEPEGLAAARSSARLGWPAARRVVCLENSRGEVYAAHTGSGLMAVSPQGGFVDESAWAEWLADFLLAALGRDVAIRTGPRPGGVAGTKAERPGVFCVLVGLDGSGKTTLARELIGRLARSDAFGGVRYFHWLPSLRAVEFPWPESGNLPRHREQRRGPVAAMLSAARLLKNLLRVRVAWWLRLRPWLRRGGTVLVDRYFYNYFLDPASVRYQGPERWLALAARWFPQPDVIAALRAPTEVLLQRKQELTETELREQAARLEALNFGRARVIRLDSTRPPRELADAVWQAMVAFHPPEQPAAERGEGSGHGDLQIQP